MPTFSSHRAVLVGQARAVYTRSGICYLPTRFNGKQAALLKYGLPPPHKLPSAPLTQCVSLETFWHQAFSTVGRSHRFLHLETLFCGSTKAAAFFALSTFTRVFLLPPLARLLEASLSQFLGSHPKELLHAPGATLRGRVGSCRNVGGSCIEFFLARTCAQHLCDAVLSGKVPPNLRYLPKARIQQTPTLSLKWH